MGSISGATMRSQRPPGAAPALAGRAEALPLDDGAVDAAMACVTIHNWEPPEAGLQKALRSGAWDAEHGWLRERDSLQGSLRLVISDAC